MMNSTSIFYLVFFLLVILLSLYVLGVFNNFKKYISISQSDSNNKFIRNLVVGFIVSFIIIIVINNKTISFSNNDSIPENWVGKKLYNVVDGRDWIIVFADHSFILHEYIPNAEETYEWRGKIENMKLITSKGLRYQGRNDYKPTEIDPNIELMDVGNKFLRINFNGFSTISGSYETDGRNYTPKNVSPF